MSFTGTGTKDVMWYVICRGLLRVLTGAAQSRAELRLGTTDRANDLICTSPRPRHSRCSGWRRQRPRTSSQERRIQHPVCLPEVPDLKPAEACSVGQHSPSPTPLDANLCVGEMHTPHPRNPCKDATPRFCWVEYSLPPVPPCFNYPLHPLPLPPLDVVRSSTGEGIAYPPFWGSFA